jgi:hypothetical protein
MAQTVDRKMVRSWTEELEAVGNRLSDHFARSEVRQRAQDYLLGLRGQQAPGDVPRREGAALCAGSLG